MTWEPCDEPVEYGPPKPDQCVDGPTTHRWTVAIEEGRPTWGTDDCRLCTDALHKFFDDHEVEMEPIVAHLRILTERQADDVWCWLQFVAVTS